MKINMKGLVMMAPQERYEQQLDDPRWKFKADNIRIRDKHKCRICGATRTQLDVHHIRYIYGREAWDYDDGDLVTLCHYCHEEIHESLDFEKLQRGSYFYCKDLRGVGIVEFKHYDRVSFRACWAEAKHYKENGHGRLYVEDDARRENIRAARADEIKDFWEKVEKYYGIATIIFYFGEHLKALLPADHPIRIKAHNYYKEALNTYESQKSFVKEKFNYFLLVSDDSFAQFDDNRQFDYPCKWSSTEAPSAFFHVASRKDVNDKPKEDNRKSVAFADFDFAGFRAATQEEVSAWLDYNDYMDSLNEGGLPF